jgi:hypothetical protein
MVIYVEAYFFLMRCKMKNLFAALSFLVQGIGAIFDFAGFLQEDNLHEKHDASAIRKDWGSLHTDYSNSAKYISGRINGFSKQ